VHSASVTRFFVKINFDSNLIELKQQNRYMAIAQEKRAGSKPTLKAIFKLSIAT
jgi:hypothetical protein